MKIIFSRNTTKFILGVFSKIFHPICIVCKGKITKKNLGAVIRKGYICSDFTCLMELSDESYGLI